jgi:ABC-type branched-subunit amino acid transport system substrate-binding protein
MSEDPAVADFVRQYEAGYAATPGVLAASGYDTVRLLRKILADPGCTEGGELQRRLLGMEPFQGVTGAILFDENREVRKEPFLLTVSGRRLKLVD